MTTLHTLVLIVHVLIGAMIVALVLLQRGKGADAGAAFGAGASGTVFGARGSANFLSRSTAVLAMLFFSTSLGLAYLGAQRKAPESLLDAVVTPADLSTDASTDVSTKVPGEVQIVTTPGVGPTSAPTPPAELPALPALPAGAPAEGPPGQPGE